MAAPAAEPPCGLCSAAAAPYTCPRCHLRLCSLRCYRAHGGCAEAFYRRQVLEALEAERGVPPPRLPPLREAEDPARPAGRGLWAQLSPAERAGFQRLLGSGEAAAELLPPWRPWWWRRRQQDDEEEEEEEEEDEAPSSPPPFPAFIPALSSLAARPPSPLLPFQLPNVLYGYAFALSLHAGDESLLPELPAAALDVSAALRSRCSFASAAEALHAARRAAAAAGYPRCPLGDAGTVLAVAELLANRGGDDVAVALGHLAKLLKKGSRRLGPEGRRLFGRARRKCRYLLAWSRQAPAAVAAAAEAARRVHAALAGEEAEAAELSRGLERGWGGARPPGERRLIQELD